MTTTAAPNAENDCVEDHSAIGTVGVRFHMDMRALKCLFWTRKWFGPTWMSDGRLVAACRNKMEEYLRVSASMHERTLQRRWTTLQTIYVSNLRCVFGCLAAILVV